MGKTFSFMTDSYEVLIKATKFQAITLSGSQVYKSLVYGTELIRLNTSFVRVLAAYLFRFFSFIVILRVSISLVPGAHKFFKRK